jgi:glycosyltransferase involved in cell wall biosynthesis
MIVELVGKFYDNHSLAIVNRYLAKELSKHTKVIVSPTDNYSHSNSVSKDDIAVIESLRGTAKDRAIAPDIQLRHSYPPIWHWPASEHTKVVYIQPWEFSKVPFEWQYKFETFADALITPSTWTSDVFREGGLNPQRIFTIGNGYNPDIFYPVDRSEAKKEYVFLFVGCDQYRKGFDILINAWAACFSNKDNVHLIVKDTPKVYGKTSLQENIVKLQYNKRVGKITYIDDDYSEHQMAELYNKANVIVHPYRGEGFGMPIQEAMACGVIPLVTSGGATDDFVEDFKINSRAIVVDINKIFAGKPGDSFNRMGAHTSVLEPDVEHLKSQMLELYKFNKTVTKKPSNIKTWNHIGAEYFKALTMVYEYDSVRRLNGS